MDIKKRKLKGYIALTILVIVCMLVVSAMTFFAPNRNAEAITSGNITSQSTNLNEMLLTGYENGGSVFNGDVFWKLISQISNGAITNKEKFDNWNTSTPKTSADFRSYNSSKDVVVTINGKQWIAVYLSQNNTDSSPILTFWLANTTTTASFNVNSTNSSGRYPSNMYGTSYLRASVLNNGGGYALNYNDTSLTPVTPSTSSDWAIYTMSKSDKVDRSIKDFLEVPNNMSWQRSQGAQGIVTSLQYTDSKGFNNNFNNNNDALDTGGNGNYNYITNTTVSTEGYKGWAQDTLWIPSVAETGVNGEEGIWKATNSTRASNTDSQLRSASSNTGSWRAQIYIDSYGTAAGSGSVADPHGVRPAFHLNLKKAVEYVSPRTPSDVSNIYNGLNQNCFDSDDASNWYDEDIFSADKANVKIEYKLASGGTYSSNKPIDCEEYKARLTIQNSDYTWADGSSVKEITFTITQATLRVNFNSNSTPPTATPNASDLCSRDSGKASSLLKIRYTASGYDAYVPPTTTDVYKASVEIDESVSKNYVLDKDYYVKFIAVPTLVPMNTSATYSTYSGTDKKFFVEIDADDVADISVTPSSNVIDYINGWITVKDADNYSVDFDIVTLDGTVKWASRDTSTKRVEFEIENADISFSILSGSSSSLEVEEGHNLSVKIDDADGEVFGSDTIHFDVIATMSRFGTQETVYSMSIDRNNMINDFPMSITLNTAGLDATDWKISIVPSGTNNSNANYNILLDDNTATLTVHPAGMANRLRWTFEKDGTTIITYNSSTLDESSTYTGKIEYDGSEISLSASANGYDVDTTYGLADGFVGGYKNEKGTNADTYTTQVALKKDGTTTVYSVEWTIDPAKFNLSTVKWLYDGRLPYNGGSDVYEALDDETIPEQLTVTYSGSRIGNIVGNDGTVTVEFALKTEYQGNYVLPVKSDPTSYTGSAFEWSKHWQIVPATIPIEWDNKTVADEDEVEFEIKTLKDSAYSDMVEYVYFETDSNGNIIDPTAELKLENIKVSASDRKYYVAKVSVKSGLGGNYALESGVSEYSPFFSVGGGSTAVTVTLTKNEFEYNNGKAVDVKSAISINGTVASNLTLTYYKDDVIESNKLDGEPSEVGKYYVVVTSNSSTVILSDPTQFEFRIFAAKIAVDWKTTTKPYILNLKAGQINGVEYEIIDAGGNIIEVSQITAGNTYKIRAKIKSEQVGNYVFVSDDGEAAFTDWEEFTVNVGDEIIDPNDPSLYPSEAGEAQNPPDDNNGGAWNEILEKIKDLPLWQLIASIISIILTIIFLSKTASNEGKRKKAKKLIDKKYGAYYAATFLGISVTNWTVIACVLMGVAVLSLIFMIISGKRRANAEEELDEAKDEYERRNKDDEMKRMFMMFGGNPNMGGMGGQGGYGYAQQGIGAEEMRLMINDAMTAMIPNVTQYLPQQASTNDELVEKLMEQNARNEEMIEKLMDRLSEQQPATERIVEREVASSNANDEMLKDLKESLKEIQKQINSASPVTTTYVNDDRFVKVIEKTEHNDETIKHLLKNQEMLMEKILELSNNKPTETQVVEKIVEVPVEVEKVVEKIVEVTAEKPAPKAKAASPRLTLDEAYEKLSATQKKIFDTLKAYAMSKDKCKEKKSTYFIVLGQSTVNPLVKLTIKKNTTVAMFKMEDEYFKDIRKNAGSDGTKVKVKESEVVVGDMQALATAKEMIDLREDQIERYNDYLKEQKSMRKK